ncbi:hypothetical protein SEVIR_3G195466v4 [Setaria viridis]|uniref:Uncharacterized protein n=1 Tax=Setaria viridis TaxID=4556 RepID=A0A4U6VB06_SETVI|nr:hypothetical protein SEVIR_3G195466v2 [Setaria viridis]TKW26518.1 hypothetical protein SEVIR_3G195466v2 [Setaria viridis]TKW26519.1 hypothetical protein SEVIR_3G195466v2 [Setaria viridis]
MAAVRFRLRPRLHCRLLPEPARLALLASWYLLLDSAAGSPAAASSFLCWRRRDPWRGRSRVDAAPSPLAVPCPKASEPDAAYYLRCPVGAAAHRPSHQWPCELPPEPPRRRLWKPLQWRASREHDAEEPRGSSAVLPLDAVTLPLYPTLVHTAALTCPSAPSSAISVTRDRA